MKKISREELLNQGYTEEQVTYLLNTFHGVNEEQTKEIEDLKAKLLEKAELEAKYNEVQKQLDEEAKAKLTEQEKINLMKKETEENYKKSQIIVNKAKALEILSGLDIDDTIIDTLVTEDETKTIANATALKNKFDNYKEVVEKQTKEAITNLDPRPNPTNIPQGDNAMTIDKFNTLSAEDQEKFITEHPDEFEKL